MRKIKYILYLSILASSIFFMGPTIQIQDVEAQVCVPIVMLSSTYNCDLPCNRNVTCAIGTHKACFLSRVHFKGDGPHDCKVYPSGGGWSIDVQKDNTGCGDDTFCSAICLD